MHDAKNRSLKAGDRVLLTGTIQLLTASEDYCNVTVVSELGRRPDGLKETISGINTGVLLRANPDDEN